MSPVVIVSPERDDHALVVRDRLHAAGVAVRIVDTTRFPRELTISMGERASAIELDGDRFTPQSVYVRDLGLDFAGRAARERAEVVLALGHRWEMQGIPIYNPLSAVPRTTRPYQLATLARAGLPVPDTLWTNDAAALRRFAADRRIAHRPIGAGTTGSELVSSDLSDERLAALRAAPVCVHELLPGELVRAYVLDDEVIASLELDRGAPGVRADERAVRAFRADADLQRICIAAARALGLRFTAVDLAAAADGRLKIVELDASPGFLGFDRAAGTDIAGALCAALAEIDRTPAARPSRMTYRSTG